MNTRYKPLTQIESQFDKYYADGHYQKAIVVMEKFIKECEDMNNPYGTLVAHFSIASCYYCLGQIEPAFESVLQYAALCEQYGDQHEQFNLCHIKALLYEYDYHYDQAKTAISECIRIAELLNLSEELSASYIMLSRLLFQTEHFDEAIIYAKKALILLSEQHTSEDLFLHCQAYCYLAISYAHTNCLKEAQVILDLLSSNPFIQSYERERSIFLYVTALLCPHTIEAQLYLLEAATIATYTKDITLKKSISWQLALYYEHQQQYELAYRYMKQVNEATQELSYKKQMSKANKLGKQYQLSSLERRANIDSLSGTLTRANLEATCDQWLTDARQTKDLICCIVFDIDNFKHINDQYGHLVGDEVIKFVGQTCRRLIHDPSTLVGRYGGDEFVIILKNYTHAQVMQKAQELFNTLCNSVIKIDSLSFQFTVSMGLVCNQSIIARKFKQIFRVADQALYTAKKEGKNQIVTLSNDNCKTRFNRQQ